MDILVQYMGVTSSHGKSSVNCALENGGGGGGGTLPPPPIDLFNTLKLSPFFSDTKRICTLH